MKELPKEVQDYIYHLQSRLESLEKTKASLCRALDDAGDAMIEAGEKIEALEKDAARWREVLINDGFVVCTSELDEIFKSKLEYLVDTAMQANKGE